MLMFMFNKFKLKYRRKNYDKYKRNYCRRRMNVNKLNECKKNDVDKEDKKRI